MREKLTFKIADNRIAELFGIQNFASKEIAILELVKNAYDAGASNLEIVIEEDSIVVVDNGIGMTKDIIRTKWMDVGVSEKDYFFTSINNEKRVYSGSKGIGRFALARLGKEIELVSKSKNNESLCWITDWNINILDDYDYEKVGTRITIKKLNDNWSEKDAKKLVRYISLYKFYDSFKVFVHYKTESFQCDNLFNVLQDNKHSLSKISFSYSSSIHSLSVEIENNEFDDKAQNMLDEYISNSNNSGRIIPRSIELYKAEFDVIEEIPQSEFLFSADDLTNIGDFSGILYYNNKYSKEHAFDFYYKWPRLTEDFPDGLSGLFLVRNAFCISGYSGETDWFGLGKRARKSPASASHKTGRWRIRENQIAGLISIDKRINKSIIELQNRQGIENNISFILFKEIIGIAIDCFEKYRQSIVRIIDTKNLKDVELDSHFVKDVDNFIKNPHSIEKMSRSQIADLAKSVKIVVDSSNDEKKKYIRKQADVDYASRLLHSLSTLGLKSASIAHEFHTDRNNLSSFYQSMVNSLVKYNLWEMLSDEEHTKQKAYNIPALLNDAQRINNSILNYIDSMLNTVNKQKFIVSDFNLYFALKDICDEWSSEFSWVNFDLNIDHNELFFGSKDIFETIFGNLILNSIQQNDKNKTLSITIKCSKNADVLNIEYADDGIGLDNRFLKNPYQILEPHVSSREYGHGLGMWIVYNLVNNYKGEITDIDGINGFRFVFYLKEKKNEN